MASPRHLSLRVGLLHSITARGMPFTITTDLLVAQELLDGLPPPLVAQGRALALDHRQGNAVHDHHRSLGSARAARWPPPATCRSGSGSCTRSPPGECRSRSPPISW